MADRTICGCTSNRTAARVARNAQSPKPWILRRNSAKPSALQHADSPAVQRRLRSMRFNSRVEKNRIRCTNPLRFAKPSNSLAICNVSDSGRNKMRYRLMTAALAASAAMITAGAASAADLEVIHWWTSKRQVRSCRRSSPRPSTTTVRETSGWTAPLPARRNRSLDGHAAHHRRRSDGSRAVQPRPSVRRADSRRHDARSDRRGNRRQNGQRSSARRRSAAPASSTATGGAFRSTFTRGYWAWYSKPAFEKAGRARCRRAWHEFVAAAPELKKAGIIPFAIGGDGKAGRSSCSSRTW